MRLLGRCGRRQDRRAEANDASRADTPIPLMVRSAAGASRTTRESLASTSAAAASPSPTSPIARIMPTLLFIDVDCVERPIVEISFQPGKAPKRVAALRIGTRLGEGVEAFGFPHSDLLSTSGNFTLGNVAALTGLHDDSRYLQVSVPVQAGNSGGPLLDGSGKPSRRGLGQA